MINNISFTKDEEDYVVIGENVKIKAFNFIVSKTKVNSDCILEPLNIIKNSILEKGCQVTSSKIIDSKAEKDVIIGPNAHLRPNSLIKEKAKIGNFVEIKQSIIGKNTKVSHMSYVGNGEIGENTNIGCGVIFCNYDGVNKYKTIVGSDVFVGSNVNLIAPVKLEDNSFVAAGSTITNSIKKHSFAIARAKQIEKKGWKSKKE